MHRISTSCIHTPEPIENFPWKNLTGKMKNAGEKSRVAFSGRTHVNPAAEKIRSSDLKLESLRYQLLIRFFRLSTLPSEHFSCYQGILPSTFQASSYLCFQPFCFRPRLPFLPSLRSRPQTPKHFEFPLFPTKIPSPSFNEHFEVLYHLLRNI